MTTLLWLPIILSSVCLFFIYLFKLAVGTRKSIEERIIVSKQLKITLLYLIGLVWIYTLIYRVPDSLHLVVENSLKGDSITQQLMNMTLILEIILSTFLIVGFIRSVIKTIVGILRNRKLSTVKEKQRKYN